MIWWFIAGIVVAMMMGRRRTGFARGFVKGGLISAVFRRNRRG